MKAILEMDVPESCSKCPLSEVKELGVSKIEGICHATGNEVDKELMFDKRDPSCPLKEAGESEEGNRIKFMLNGCDIWFIASAPEDITLKQLLQQCSRIHPDYCDCGIRYLKEDEERYDVQAFIYHDDVKKADDDVSCSIR